MKKTESLRKNKEFKKVYSEGKSLANRYLVMYIISNQLQQNRIGISVSKKVGNSVVRHRIKRLIKESYRINEDLFMDGLDIVIIARANASAANYHQIDSALMHISGMHKIIKGRG